MSLIPWFVPLLRWFVGTFPQGVLFFCFQAVSGTTLVLMFFVGGNLRTWPKYIHLVINIVDFIVSLWDLFRYGPLHQSCSA